MNVCLILFLLVAGAASLRAHAGHTSETNVNLTQKTVTVVLRCEPVLAWSLLGPKVPHGSLKEAFVVAKPDLEALTPALFIFKSNEEIQTPTQSRVVVEVNNHLAFVLTFARPTSGKLTLQAPFLDKLDELTVNKVGFFDHSLFPHPAEPFASIELQKNTQTLSFTGTTAELLKE